MKIYYASIVGMVTALSAQQAMVIKPVIDIFFSADIPQYSVASFDQESDTCKRAHQLLMHDLVTIHEKKGEVCTIKVPQAYYIDGTGKVTNLYWTTCNNLMPLARQPQGKTVTLIRPYHEKTLNIRYSHGTQFARAGEAADTVPVHAYDPRDASWRLIELPRESCLLDTPTSPQEQRRLCINLILESIQCAARTGGVIPYVWGGKSFTFAQPDEFFTHVDGFDRVILTNPVTGFDCSGLILHYAQICGIPYVYKSSTTLEAYGQELSVNDIKPGDIVWIPGHVMMIKNDRELIEAAGYKWLYGRVHTIAIKDKFKNAHTIKDIFRNFKKYGFITELNKHKVPKRVSNVKLFSLFSGPPKAAQ